MDILTPLLNSTFFGNTLQAYLVAAFILIGVVVVLKIFKHVIIRRIKVFAEKTQVTFDDAIVKALDVLGWPLFLVVALYLALQVIVLPQIVERAVAILLLIIATFYVVRGIQELLNWSMHAFSKRMGQREEAGNFDASMLRLLSNVVKGMLWGVAILLILQNLGYNITTLIAGLGIGGIAIAFALQNILTDVFSAFSIHFDKPFQVGDFIIIGDDKGTVEKIGIKSTRIRTLQGEELVLSNKELTETRVRNFKRMEKRRIQFAFGVVYQTSTENMKKVPEIVRDIIGGIELAELDRVHFVSFGDFSLNFEVVYYVNSREYTTYMDVQQEINLALKERFEKENIDMAYPTQTVFLSKE